MKNFFTLCLLFCLSTQLWGQNVMFVDFEKFVTFEEVKCYFEDNPTTQIVYEQEEEILLIDVNSFTFRYDFYENMLYEITMTKQYDNYKTARSAELGCLHYFELIEGTMVENLALGNTRHYAVVKDGRVLELLVTFQHKYDITFELSSKYVDRTPAYELDRYCDQVSEFVLTRN
jgi:hypothetical protein